MSIVEQYSRFPEIIDQHVIDAYRENAKKVMTVQYITLTASKKIRKYHVTRHWILIHVGEQNQNNFSAFFMIVINRKLWKVQDEITFDTNDPHQCNPDLVSNPK